MLIELGITLALVAQTTDALEQSVWGWRVSPNPLRRSCEAIYPYDSSISVVLEPVDDDVNILLRFEGPLPNVSELWSAQTLNGTAQFFHAEKTSDGKTIALGAFISPSLEEYFLGTDRMVIANESGFRIFISMPDSQRALTTARWCQVVD